MSLQSTGRRPAPFARCGASVWAVLLAATLLASGSAGAQSDSAHTTAGDSGHATRHVFRRSDLRAAIAFASVTAALLPFDTHITNAIRTNPAPQGTSGLISAMNSAAFPGAYVVGYSIYGLGLVTASTPITRLGLYTAASVIVSSHLTDALKGEIGRARPWAASESDEFKAGGGFKNGNWTSFPSGHATVAFAAATALAEGSRIAWPNEPGFIAPLAYGAATAVGVARVYGQAHWASDVVAGAAVGTFTARLIVREGQAHPGNWLEKIAVHGVLGLDDRGRAALGWHSNAQ